MRKFCLAVSIASVLAGCAGSETHTRLLETGGDIRIDTANSATHDYVVHIKNTVDLGYNPDNPETRNSTALLALSAQCPSGRVVGESVIERGEYLIGRPARTYIIQVKCKP